MYRFVLVISAFAFLVSSSLAVTATVEGQTVLLPSFRNFTYRGAVKVPDGGMIKLGGVTRSAEGATARAVPGLGNLPGIGRGFGNRGIGRDQESGSLNATAKIIIAEELEAQHLAKAGYFPGQRADNADVLQKAAFLSKHIGRNIDVGRRSSGSSDDSWNKRR